MADIGLDVSSADAHAGRGRRRRRLAARRGPPTPTSGSARCGWSAGSPGMTAPPRWPPRRRSGPAPATCGCSTPGGGADAPAHADRGRADRRCRRAGWAADGARRPRPVRAPSWSATASGRRPRRVAERSRARWWPAPTVPDGRSTPTASPRSGATPPRSLGPDHGAHAPRRRVRPARRRSRPGADRIAAARDAGRVELGCVVLLKGRPRSSPTRRARCSWSTDRRRPPGHRRHRRRARRRHRRRWLRQGLDPFRAAAAGAFLHGRAGALGWRHGLVAGDLLGPAARSARPARRRHRPSIRPDRTT